MQAKPNTVKARGRVTKPAPPRAADGKLTESADHLVAAGKVAVAGALLARQAPDTPPRPL
jgi:hypothetical protein